MKRWWYKLLACAALLCLLAGCGGTADHTEPEKNLLAVGFSQLGSESDWRVANTRSMVGALCEANGYALEFDNARQKQDNQLAAVRNFILQGVDIILIAPTEETGWKNVLMEAREAQIPVIIVDRAVAVEDESLYLASVGSDFFREGQRAMEWLSGELETQGRGSEPVRILHLQGTYGATAQLMRTKALEDAVAQNETWQIAAQLYGDFTEAKGYEAVRDYLAAGQTFDVLYSENDNMTFGAMRALDEAGIRYGEDGDVMIISFDAVREALQNCLEGKINLCVECNPLHGPRVDELIRRYRAGEEIPKHIYVEEAIFTPDTLTQEMVDAREY